MEWVAKRLTNYILENAVIAEEDRAAYEYGFQIGLEQLLCILASLTAAFSMNRWWECVLLLFVFFLQRAYVKGIHMKQYWSCFLVSCSVVTGGLYVCGQTGMSLETEVIVSLACLSVVQFAAGRFETREDDEAVRFFNRQRKRVAIFVAVVTIILYVIQWREGLCIVCYTELVMLISTFAQLLKEKLFGNG